MLSVQDGAFQLLSDSPGPLYFLTGSEYGVKQQYIDHMESLYGNVVEVDSFSQLMSDLGRKSLIPRPKTLYIVRYDKDFVSDLSNDIASTLLSLPYDGTVVGIYQDDRSEKKLDKYFPDTTMRVNALSDVLQLKHLSNRYGSLDEHVVKMCIAVSSDYMMASNMCSALSLLSQTAASALSTADVSDLFGCTPSYDKDSFKRAVASRNYKAMVQWMDSHDASDYSEMFYDVLNALTEVAKSLDAGKPMAWVTPAMLRAWDAGQVLAMFEIVYEQVSLMRTFSSYSQSTALLYVLSMLNYRIGA